jgi:hypothetical protein
VLLCADFAKSFSGERPPWRVVWQYLRKHVQDDLGTKPG